MGHTNVAAAQHPLGKAPAGVYRFFLEYHDDEHVSLGDEPLASRDFDRARLSAYFDAVRCGVLADYRPGLDEASVMPSFSRDPSASGEGSSRLGGFSIAIPLDGGLEHCADFPITYFASRANRRKVELVRSEKMAADKALRYCLAAYLEDAPEARPAGPIELASASVAVRLQDRGGDLSCAEPWDQPDATDVPVVIRKSLVEEAVEEARDHPETEVCGFLLGHLARDHSGKLFVDVTGLVSSFANSQKTATSVTFTPESFAQAREMIALRGRGEVIVGNVHSHPFVFCEACPLPTPPECIAKILFFSQDDVDLMTTTFEHPYMVGLLTAVEPRLDRALGHLPVRLFGWRRGQLVARGFHVLPDR